MALAQSKKAVYLRVDTIEQAIRNATGQQVGPEGYEVAYAIALDNLRLGLDVVADSVNAIEITRSAWRATAVAAGSAFLEIEVCCSDMEEHQRRVEERKSAIEGLLLPTWQQVLDREYEPWVTDPVVIDTANESVQQSVFRMRSLVK